MGGGDLNMKKSWHPLLLKNQERVWLEEKKALEEKKKLDQLRKEKEEERQMQELQRLQEEQTGRKRQEKLDWMYATPATGSSQNANDLEDYLLGKKRVDKILTADENEKVGAAHKNFIATQYANTVRDTAAKIREDPLLAIKQQEQAAYQALMSNPLRLREMQERAGIKTKKEKKDKKKDKHRKDKLRDRSSSPSHHKSRSYELERRSPSPYRHRSRSPAPTHSRRHYDEGYILDNDRYAHRQGRRDSRSPDPYRRRERSPIAGRRNRDSDIVRTWPKSDDSDDNLRGGRSRSPKREDSPHDRKRRRTPSPRRDFYVHKRSRMSPPPQTRPGAYQSKPAANLEEERAARLAAMTSNASSMSDERRERLAIMLKREKDDLEAEERERVKSKGMGGFLSSEQKKVFGGAGGIEERIRRGRGQMRVDGD